MKAALEELPVAGTTKSTGASARRKQPRIGTILVPTDFSDESLKAVRYATSLLQQFDGALHLVHVQDVDYSYAIPPVIAVPPVITAGELEAYCRGELRKIATEHVAMDRPPALHCATGRAFDQICRVAAEIGADLIVISTHGRTGLKHLVLGSTAERVVRHSPCPVLVVREAERDFVKGGVQTARTADSLRLKRILVPVDFSECSVEGLRYAVEFARMCGAKLQLVHALQVQPFIPADRFAAYSREPSPGVIERAAKLQMRKLVRRTDFKGVPYETRIEIGQPAYQVCETAARDAADLIIIPTHGLTGFAHVFLGSTAEHVVRYARCPVIVVPMQKQNSGGIG